MGVKQLVIKDGKYYFVDTDTLKIYLVRIDEDTQLAASEREEVLKVFIKTIIGDKNG